LLTEPKSPFQLWDACVKSGVTNELFKACLRRVLLFWAYS
jgi:hypothetical protein